MIGRTLICGVCAVALFAGCETSSRTAPGGVPRTEGERTLARSRMLERQGEMMTKAERLIADGNAERSRGQALRDQGNTVEGERTMAEGEAKIREGEALMQEARAMPIEPQSVEPDARTAGDRTDYGTTPTTRPASTTPPPASTDR